MSGGNLCHMGEGGGKVNKKKRIVHMWGTTLFFWKEIILWTNTFIYVNKN